jgi:hypothetical protein
LAKTKISSADLAHIFVERLSAFKDCPARPSVAIVPDTVSGWLAVASKPNRRSKPIPVDRLKEVERTGHLETLRTIANSDYETRRP